MTLEKFEGEARKNISHSQIRSYVLTALIIITVVALGLFALNQFLDFKYKSYFLSSPCDLCLELNPHLENCFDRASTVVIDQKTGEIVDPFNLYGINLDNLSLEDYN